MQGIEILIGWSIGCFLPLAVLPGLWPLWEYLAKKYGCDFWQMLPIRNLPLKALKNFPVSIPYTEADWRGIRFWKHVILRHRGKEDLAPGGLPYSFGLLDLLFFDEESEGVRKRIIRETDATYVSHSPDDLSAGALFELRPETKISFAEALALAEKYPDPRLVLDTWHLRRRFPAQEPTPTLAQLLAKTALLHIQTSGRQELQRFLAKESTWLEEFFCRVREAKWKGPIVLELSPVRGLGIASFNPFAVARLLQTTSNRIREILAD